jgi:hypothetical protein
VRCRRAYEDRDASPGYPNPDNILHPGGDGRVRTAIRVGQDAPFSSNSSAQQRSCCVRRKLTRRIVGD